MKKWYQWLFLSLGFSVGGGLNCLNGRECLASFIPAIVTILLAMIQFFCDKKGDAGKCVFRYISICMIVVLAVSLIFLLFAEARPAL